MRNRQVRSAQVRTPEISTRRSARDRSNPLRSSPRRPARDKSGISSCVARHSFHTVAPRPSIATCSSFAIFHPCQPCGELRSAVAVRSIELSVRQAFGTIQIGIRQICAVELCQANIRAPQISTPKRRPDQERTTKPGITEVGSVQPCMTKIRRHAGSPCGGQPRRARRHRAERRSCRLHAGKRLSAPCWPPMRTPSRPWRGRRPQGLTKRGSPRSNALGINPHSRSTPPGNIAPIRFALCRRAPVNLALRARPGPS